MPKVGNIHFVRSTKLKASEILSVGGRSVWDSVDVVFARIDQLCGEGAARLFSEPNAKRQGDSDVLNVAWFGSFDDDAQELDTTDRARFARLQEHLVQRLAALRPALVDPVIGETVAAMLNLYDHKSIVAVGEHVVLVNWGALPTEATASQSAYARHTDTTIGRFLASDLTPRLPGRDWAAKGVIEPHSPSQPAAMAMPGLPASLPTAGPVSTASREVTRLWPPAALAAIFGLVFLYLSLPGNLIYEKEAGTDHTALSQLEASNGALSQKIRLFRSELGKDACMIDRTLAGLPAEAPPASSQGPADVTRGDRP